MVRKRNDVYRRMLWKFVRELLAGVAVGLVFGYIIVVENRKTRIYEQEVERKTLERRRWDKRLEDSLNADSKKRREQWRINMMDVEKQKRINEQLKRLGGSPDDELLERYNNGEELTPEEEDRMYEHFKEYYYDDPDDEGNYPSEVFDAREDYDEEHVRNNPGVAGDD